MRTLVREIVDVRECATIDALIERLAAVRATLPDPQDADVRMRGDDVFGWRITITYSRPPTREEQRLRRYGAAGGRARAGGGDGDRLTPKEKLSADSLRCLTGYPTEVDA